MLRFIVVLSSLLISLSAQANEDGKLPIAYENLAGVKVPKMAGIVNSEMQVPVSKFIVLDSPGGLARVAWELQREMTDRVCIVKASASAMLQIILPSCKERYYLPDTWLGFHSAHFVPMPFVPLGPQVLEKHLFNLIRINNAVAKHMRDSGFPMLQDDIISSMFEETVYTGDDLKQLEPWIRPLSECHHCPVSWKHLRGFK